MTDTSDTSTDATDVDDADPDEPTYNGDRVVAWVDGGPVTQNDFDDAIDDAGQRTTVAVAGADLLGEPSTPAVPVDAEPAVDDSGEVPEAAADVIAWVQDGETVSDAEATRRAGLAWTVEAQRSGGVRTTVEAEVDRWLETGT